MKWAGKVACAGLLALSGCSLGADNEKAATEPASGPAKQVAATVSALDRAVKARDWRTVCNRLFTPSARQRAGGKDCVRLVRSSAGQLRGARVELVGIEIRKHDARARVRTQARGQRALTDTLTLERSRGRYLVDSLR